jgi:hypothetical protein
MPISLSCYPDGLVYSVAEKDDRGRVYARGPMSSVSPEPEPPEQREQVDGRLVQRIAQGDQEALAELYQRFSGPLYGTALRVLRDPAEAQDVVHDTFVTLWEKAGTFEVNRGSAFAWAVTLVATARSIASECAADAPNSWPNPCPPISATRKHRHPPPVVRAPRSTMKRGRFAPPLPPCLSNRNAHSNWRSLVV